MSRLRILPITSKKLWNSYIEQVSPQSFFQSWEWGEVSKLNGHSIDRLGIYSKGKLVGVFQLTKVQARRGSYIMIRHGPVLLNWNAKFLLELVGYLKNYTNENYLFIRISPLIERKCSNDLLKAGFRLAPVHENIDAQICYIIDLKPELEIVLANMRKNTRRAVKKALTDSSLTVTCDTSAKSLKIFNQLYRQTAQKRGFVEWRGVDNEISEFGKNKAVDLIVIYRNRVPVAGAIINYWGEQGIYHYGASSLEGLQSNAQYLAIYEAIKNCKKRGISKLNLWGGLEDVTDTNHPWYGLTVFKRGFGPYRQTYLPTYDYVLSSGYWITFLYEQAVEYVRGYKKIGQWRSPPFLRQLFGV